MASARPPTPTLPTAPPPPPSSEAPYEDSQNPYEDELAVCQWEGCSESFSRLDALVDHLRNGANKSNYQCLWATCARRGVNQTSRFALISHLRSHTGEKPFICPVPECDKSFTRSDALAKHMRQQHNISPPLPGRGSNRKRKREENDVGDGFAASKESELAEGADATSQYADPTHPNSGSNLPGSSQEDDDELPPRLLALKDPRTGLILGRSESMCKYIIMKAKYEYAVAEHQLLLGEYEILKREENELRKYKEQQLDEVLRATFGPQAELLTGPVQVGQRFMNPPVMQH
ncbi:hypothetical protein SISNIDRAFT_485843 [Sistotremastrum niveocremeum HHB9708]|uniref:C2H2-type domain-containing protein n=1 Tax=Sistotremastrum niveocremeum HHB9708 TaxID=1314777 RepID=A0A164U3N9_9AGAM|nr:hypothetical protein SISNIDRAFT_485843 [Sistotremastrum niveocremeum HHB9708]